MDRFEMLNSPIILGRERFKNRIFSAPMSGQDITPQCTVGPAAKGFYELRAIGGAAAVTLSECSVHPKTDKSYMYYMDETIPGCLAGFTMAADAIIRHGCVPSAEISHAGRYAGAYVPPSEDKLGSKIKYGPSPVQEGGITVKELTKEQIDEIARAYGKAAAFLKRCGFKMVLVHGGHGWLIEQFLSPLTNFRTDEYGGSRENRYRFMLQVVDEVRKAVGPSFPIEFRMSGAEFVPGGYDIDEGVEIAKALDGKVDLIHVSAGVHHDCFHITHPSMFEEHGRNVYLAAEIKKNVKTPVATLGGLSDPDQMEEILRKGWADVIYLGRALLADPFLPQKIKQDRTDDIRHCLRCFTCMGERVSTQTRRCAIDPLVGREPDKDRILPSPEPKKVLIAGGGPAGMEAALMAAKRGNQVILCEKKDELGGVLLYHKEVGFKKEMYDLAFTMKKQCREAGVEIRLNTEVTPELVRIIKPDVLIIAVGGHRKTPDIPGLSEADAISINDYSKEPEKIGNNVTILGGRHAGCEMSVWLSMTGKKVTVIEAGEKPAADANPRHRPIVLEQLKKYDVQILTGKKCVKIEDGKAILDDGTAVAFDTLMIAAGQTPNWEMVDALSGSAGTVRVIGDAVREGRLVDATYTGFHAGLDI